MEQFKCKQCLLILNQDDLGNNNTCPECNSKLEAMCVNDKTTCSHPGEDRSGIIKYCDICGEPCCPICDCHDVLILSRITGYIQDVQGFNTAKSQELKDRIHYTVA